MYEEECKKMSMKQLYNYYLSSNCFGVEPIFTKKDALEGLKEIVDVFFKLKTYKNKENLETLKVMVEANFKPKTAYYLPFQKTFITQKEARSKIIKQLCK